MTQVFAHDDHVARRSAPGRPGVPVPTDGHGGPVTLGPAMTPGKGVRTVRCVGCTRQTLPRPDDGAPLCQRCCDLLAAAGTTAGGWPAASSGAGLFRAPRWLRRRSDLP